MELESLQVARVNLNVKEIYIYPIKNKSTIHSEKQTYHICISAETFSWEVLGFLGYID